MNCNEHPPKRQWRHRGLLLCMLLTLWLLRLGQPASAQITYGAVQVYPRAWETGNYIYADFDDEQYSAVVYDMWYRVKYSDQSLGDWTECYPFRQNINDKTVTHYDYSCDPDYMCVHPVPEGGQIRFAVLSREADTIQCGLLPCEGAPLYDCDTDNWLDPTTISEPEQWTGWMDAGQQQILYYFYDIEGRQQER